MTYYLYAFVLNLNTTYYKSGMVNFLGRVHSTDHSLVQYFLLLIFQSKINLISNNYRYVGIEINISLVNVLPFHIGHIRRKPLYICTSQKF